MKVLILLSLLISGLAHASTESLVYKCDFRIAKTDGKIFTFSGSIIPSDAALNDNRATYLTLAPNELSEIGLEARILFTVDNYNPITLHKPGQSATVAASTEIALGQIGDLLYVDAEGVSYKVTCQPR